MMVRTGQRQPKLEMGRYAYGNLPYSRYGVMRSYWGGRLDTQRSISIAAMGTHDFALGVYQCRESLGVYSMPGTWWIEREDE